MKKVFLTTLLVTSFFCHTVFAVKGDAQDSKAKMEQLQQILLRAAKSSSTATSPSPAINAGPTVNFNTQNAAPLANQQSATGAPNNQTAPAAVSETNNIQPPQPSAYDEAFSHVVNQMLPMTPEQIATLRKVFIETQLAASTPPGIPPKPTSTSLIVDLSPQATPPVIRLGAGYITSMVFLDSTGQPWPIEAYSIGDPGSFNIQWNRKGNTLLAQSSTFHKRSNLAVILRGLNTPVMITLISGQTAVDYRIDMRVPGFGPNAVFMQSGVPAATSPVLLDVLNGIPPKGSKEIKVAGGECQAWLVDKTLYLRTNLTVISPGWQSIISSVDGTYAYQLQPTPVILALKKGRDKVLRLQLEGLE